MKDLMPDLYDEIMNNLNESLMVLFEEDLIKVEYDEDLKVHISATDAGVEYFKSMYGE